MRVPVLAVVLGFILACGSGESVETPAPASAGAAPAPTTPAVPAAPEAPSVPVQRLAALVATSGDADALFDGNPSQGWRPTGDPLGEGVLVRFEEPTQIQSFTVTSCGGRETVTPFFNGAAADTFPVGEEVPVDLTLRSLFLRVDSGEGCLGELSIKAEGPAFAPPRTVTGSVKASSTLAPDNAYHPSYAFDSRLDFGWVEGSAGNGVAESFTVTFDSEQTVSKVQLWNGYQRSQDHFDKNARATKIALSVGGAREEFSVDAGIFGVQTLTFASPLKGKTLTLEILEAKNGSKYKDLVISELRVWDPAGPLRVKIDDTQSAALKQKTRGSAIEGLVDKLYVGACDDMGMRKLKLRSNHSFVWYDGNDMDSSTEIFDGAWVVKKAGRDATQIQLFGRRHKSQDNWNPYSTDGGKTETIRIGGGKPTFKAVSEMSAAAFAKEASEVSKAYGRDCAYDHADLSKRGAVIVKDPSMVDILVPRP